MTPLALFLLGCATVFFGTVQAAFSALMRLSLRLMAERGGRSDRLGPYLDDPLQLSGCIVAAGVLIVRLSDIHDAPSVAVFVVSLAAFVVVCEHLLPAVISRHDPESVLDVLLPVFAPLAKVMRPVTIALIDIIDVRRDREGGEEPA